MAEKYGFFGGDFGNIKLIGDSDLKVVGHWNHVHDPDPLDSDNPERDCRYCRVQKALHELAEAVWVSGGVLQAIDLFCDEVRPRAKTKAEHQATREMLRETDQEREMYRY